MPQEEVVPRPTVEQGPRRLERVPVEKGFV